MLLNFCETKKCYKSEILKFKILIGCQCTSDVIWRCRVARQRGVARTVSAGTLRQAAAAPVPISAPRDVDCGSTAATLRRRKLLTNLLKLLSYKIKSAENFNGNFFKKSRVIR